VGTSPLRRKGDDFIGRIDGEIRVGDLGELSLSHNDDRLFFGHALCLKEEEIA
jgi:hypothetical protein